VTESGKDVRVSENTWGACYGAALTVGMAGILLVAMKLIDVLDPPYEVIMRMQKTQDRLDVRLSHVEQGVNELERMREEIHSLRALVSDIQHTGIPVGYNNAKK
jgi:hypothetical protein